MKRIVAFLCVVALMLGVVNPAVFASESATAATNGTQTYSSLQAAVDNYTSGVIVLEDNASDITVNRDTYVDLNGHTIENVTVTGGTLYCADSETADYTVVDGVYGKVTGASGSVQAADGYLQIAEEDAVSFHRLNLDIYAMTLRASAVGVYYKSHFAGDELVAQQVESFGVALSVVAAPNASNLKQHCGYSTFTGFKAGEGANSGNATGTLLRDIMKTTNTDKINTRNAAMPVYGRAYIKTAEGYVFGTAVKRNLREQVEAIDGLWNGLQDTQKAPVTAMYETYTSVMEGWNIPNIKGIQTPGTNDAIEIPVDVTVENGIVTEEMIIEDQGITVTVPAGVKLAEGESVLTVVVTPLETTDIELELTDSQVMIPVDVHVDGIAADNAAPLAIHLGKVMPENLNMGNYTIYHVENGKANEMTLIPASEEFTAHNQYKYTLDGEVILYMANFSNVLMVSDENNAWNGDRDYEWYDAEAETLYIRNADQLAGFGAIVGGMDGQTQDSFNGKTVKLLADIYFGDLDSENGIVFYPIGYYNSEGTYEKTGTAITSGFKTFEGTFDGNGNTISDFYQNTWEMKGDHNWYDATLQYYRDGMGLFGKVYGGTVKNLTVENFSSDGEIATTGVIAAYADCGATFENISIFGCNPRVYNIGNGGIVGCVGWYANDSERNKVITFKNITVDNSNKISALWGSYDVACGGLVGQYYPTSGQSNAIDNAGIYMENCHVSAQMDVYNDVCANYQYYAYRYTGMLIGSVRENETIDGHVYPKMDGIEAKSCTVHFGDWNDYYYCELVADSLASYTHDHQMSRLVEIKEISGTTITYLDGTTGTVPASGRANYVIVDYAKGHGSDNATCYHFLDGAVWTHEQGGYETTDVDGDGTIDSNLLKEDKQHIYLEFNNLVTGYGWGVTTKAVGDMEGVTILDREEGSSAVKFEKADTAENTYFTGATVTIGELFKAATIEDSKLTIVGDKVQVTVSPATEDEDNTASGTYVANTTDWTQGTLTFSGTGAATITITDYYFCTPTTIEVTITEQVAEEKFDIALNNGDFLHRVGNSGTVTLDKLFKAKDGATIGTVSVTVETLNETAASGTYTSNATWTNGTIQFSGTGVVKVTITDNDYCMPAELVLEVVDAKNVTAATSATANNVVLLNDTSGTFSVTNGYTFYGNGFTVTLPTTSVQNVGNGFTGYISIGGAQDDGVANGGHLDNVRIKGPVYPEMYIYRDQAKITDSSDADYGDGYNMRYFKNSVIVYGGNCTISNCYISGSRTALCLRGGNNVVIENTTLSGGAYANMQICAGSNVTLRDLTTVQTDVTDSYGKGKTAHGLGIAVDSNVVNIYIEGELKQYNWLNETIWNAQVPSVYQSSFPDFFGDNKYSKYWHYLDSGTDPYVNLAFVFACNWDTSKIHDNRTAVDYETCDSTIAGVAGGVYSKVNTVGGNAITDSNLADPGYTAPGFNPVAPVFEFDNTANADADDENDAADTYCVYDEASGTLKIGITGDSKTIDLAGVTVTKNGTTLAHTAYLNGTQISGDTVTIYAADGAKQILTVKATSNDAGYDKDGSPIDGSIEYTWTVTVEIATLAYPAPVWNMGDDYQFDTSNCYYAYYSTSQGYGEAVPIYEGIKINYYNKSGELVELDLSGTTTLPTGSENSNSNAFTYTLADGSTLTMKFSSGWKSGATTHQFTTYNKKVYIYPQSLDNDNYVRAKTTNQDFNVKITYNFTDPNGQSTGEQTMQWYNAAASNGNVDTVQWKTFDSTNGKECIVKGTLITLADGTQVPVEELTGTEELLVWNLETGSYDSAPIVFVDSDAETEYEIVHLYFSDGTDVEVIYEHGFFDTTLGEYVYLDRNNAADYIGHSFVKQGNIAEGTWENVQLTDVVIENKVTTAYSPVTFSHLCYYVDGMLSMPGGIEGLFNIFEVNTDTMAYDAEKKAADIETYGLFTYEDFADVIPEEAFYAFNGAYLKVAIGKGMLTWADIEYLAERYVPLM